ncbi:MAG: hypothetical protein HOP21_02995 [Methylotenera sp.]|nr:hypothetical protein [Methylotenera sp.]
MQKKKNVGKVSWFNIDNYKDCESFTASDWSNEILQRILMHHHCLNDCTYFDEQEISSIDLKDGLDQIESIKKFGLFKNSSLYKAVGDEPKILFLLKKQKKSAIYLDDITEFEAYEFFHASPNKEQIQFDMDLLLSNLVSFERNEKLESLFKQYQSPFSATTNKDFDYGARFLQVNLESSDECLKRSFEKWLKTQRKNSKFTSENIRESKLNSWDGAKLLAYWDICTICEIEKIKIGLEAIGDLIFRKEFSEKTKKSADKSDINLQQKMQRVIVKKAREMISLETLEILYAQGEAEK